MPVEIIRNIGEYLTMRNINSLRSTCKNIHASLVGQFYFERQVEWELSFDAVRQWLVEHQDDIQKIVKFTRNDIASWPESRAERYASNDSDGAQILFKFLDQCIDVWGAGILYFTFSVFDTFWDPSLVKLLPKYHREGSLINRAIRSNHDTRVLEQIINAYSVKYKASLDGLKEPQARRRFAGYILKNDLPLSSWRVQKTGSTSWSS
ncbi:hypothetical protein PG996_007917 [Apiospora saccharicola]|uniref:F-box domain-containing protein n=1 Tax=Apiospora saccharicola TaxID=335842 RepID=A0ABR1UWI0_9PEZI